MSHHYKHTTTLSSREKEVVTALLSGWKLTAYAKAAGLSVKTASTYRLRAQEKMKLNTPGEWAKFLRGAGQLELPL